MGDAARFATFARTHQDLVYATAWRLLANEADAKDVAQATLLKAWERFAALEAHPAPAAWLRTVATHLALNHLRRHRARWLTDTDADPTERSAAEAALADERASAQESSALWAGRAEALRLALRDLPDAFRVPLVLHVYEELPYDTIAERLGVSLGKVKTDIHRARNLLRQRLLSDASLA
jgi:RNA polymerase sigma-70 factor (ECF subfamily)